ncbi:hypothetical protein SFC55_26070 [Niallia taxi]|uniref:hypothetical protein n=1 Tax=Niallia taxi TaxID=2499688 RepID=UPI00398280D0
MNNNASVVKARAEEIKKYDEILKGFGVSFSKLASISPDEEATKVAFDIAKIISERPSLKDEFYEFKALPTERLSELGFDEGIMRKYRLYITAITILFIEDFKHLQSYVGGL